MKLNDILGALNFFKQWKNSQKKEDREITGFFLTHDKIFGKNVLDQEKTKWVLEKYNIWIDGRKINAVIKLKNKVNFTDYQIYNAYKAGFINVDDRGKASFNIQNSRTMKLIIAATIFLVFAILTSLLVIFKIPSGNSLLMALSKLIVFGVAIGTSIFIVGTTFVELVSNRFIKKLIASKMSMGR